MSPFDHINHAILLKLIRRRIKDRRIIALIDSFLKAGVMEDGLFQYTEEGTPQGGIISPLLANIYLHEFDLWWWRKYGSLTPYQKSKRRKEGVGNCILIRYADDWIILCNGPRAEAYRLRDEAQEFLWEKLHLELSLEKTHVTHVTDGFDFLGFHIEWKTPRNGRPWLRVTPTKENVKRLRHKIKTMTTGRTVFSTPEQKLKAVNRVLRGWAYYYRHVSLTATAVKMDWWVNRRMVRWLVKKHRVGIRRVLGMYKVRETKGSRDRWNIGVKDSKGEMIYLFRMADIHLTRYLHRKRPNPYLDDEPISALTEDTPFPDLGFQ